MVSEKPYESVFSTSSENILSKRIFLQVTQEFHQRGKGWSTRLK